MSSSPSVDMKLVVRILREPLTIRLRVHCFFFHRFLVYVHHHTYVASISAIQDFTRIKRLMTVISIFRGLGVWRRLKHATITRCLLKGTCEVPLPSSSVTDTVCPDADAFICFNYLGLRVSWKPHFNVFKLSHLAHWDEQVAHAQRFFAHCSWPGFKSSLWLHVFILCSLWTTFPVKLLSNKGH